MQNNLKMERARLKMTQADLAAKVGVSRQTINAIEQGKYGPSTILALRLSLVFDKSVNELFALDEDDLN
ncbi:helix-turn-helix transcriptional regulator [Zeaxanthinibacter enoshimensis]|uniref:Putative transcriptional regulator n=1 Tax=Zeaxanthinibacter enoshimensis TaxID=392009 RepID=A0A4R6TLI6_9FLAO|nr:helix-turn-helix transcriptional regulator [Zeaxanthinibacter enoshimensis]TDQ32322.1 putative transcriptional regulator [Zeaxanthinibacter enoshimensis]